MSSKQFWLPNLFIVFGSNNNNNYYYYNNNNNIIFSKYDGSIL